MGKAVRIMAEAVVIISGVNPVIHRPDEAAGLVLHVPTTTTALIPEGLLIRNAVAVGVLIAIDVEGVRLTDQDAIVKREDHARKEEVIGKNGVLIVSAIAIGVFMKGDAAFLLLFTGGICVLHVGPHFHDVETAIAIEGTGDGLFDLWLGENGLKRVSFGEVEGLQAFLYGEVRSAAGGWINLHLISRSGK